MLCLVCITNIKKFLFCLANWESTENRRSALPSAHKSYYSFWTAHSSKEFCLLLIWIGPVSKSLWGIVHIWPSYAGSFHLLRWSGLIGISREDFREPEQLDLSKQTCVTSSFSSIYLLESRVSLKMRWACPPLTPLHPQKTERHPRRTTAAPVRKAL